MYSILIVDDFDLDRRALADLTRSMTDLPLMIIGECENGYSALDAVHNLQPDILLCDVEMPGLSGIDLANTLRREGNNISIIFCSIYDKLHYLQDAIRCECAGYLMKPVSADDLRACFTRVMLKRSDILRREEEFSSLKLSMQENRVSMTRELFSDILLGGETSGINIEHRLRQVGLSSDLSARLALINLNACVAGTPDEDASLVPFHVYRSIKMGRDWSIPYYVVRISETRYAVVFCFESGEKDADFTRRQVEQALTAFVQRMRSEAISITTTFGHQITDLRELPAQYRLCRYRLDHCSRYGGDDVIFADDPYEAPRADVPDIPRIRQLLRTALNTDGDIETQAYRAAQDALEGLTLSRMQMVCHFALSHALQTVYEENETVQDDSHLFDGQLAAILTLNDENACRSFLRALILYTCGILHTDSDSVNSELIEDIKTFIQTSDLKTIHLQRVAEHFSYSPNYLNHVFKTATGQTILDYITFCRIECAKELLKSGKPRLTDVAEAVGYSHATYLSIVFKKQEGITPKQYMERSRT